MRSCPRPKPGSGNRDQPWPSGQNTNDHYIKHPPVHFDQTALKPLQALPLLTSEFINPVGVTARKHKIHWLPCSLSDLTVCLSIPPSLPDCRLCSLLKHSRWDNCIESRYDAPGIVPVTALISPVAPLMCTRVCNNCNGFQMVCGEYDFSTGGCVCVWACTYTW